MLRASSRRLYALAGIPAIALTLSAPMAAQAPTVSELPAAAMRQIEALMAEKAQRTPAQQKVSSRLLHEQRVRRGETIPAEASLRRSIEVASDGIVTVDIRADVTPDLLARINDVGGAVVSSLPAYREIRARLPLDGVDTIAALSEVQFIRPADQMSLHRSALAAVGRYDSQDPESQKINTSEGDIAHRVALARALYGVTGAGIGIGVLSNGVDTLAARQASGDLPAVTILPGQAGTGDEGTAMLEIVSDLAPGANLFFATANGGQAQFAANIEALCNAGAKVIVDHAFYLAESVFQDGIVAQGVNNAAANGCIYFSAAGDAGNKNDGTSGVWEGDFVAAAANPAGVSGTAHNFGGGANSNQITQDTSSQFTLQWSDPRGGSANDYDLYLFNAALNTIFDQSNDTQNGTQDPFEAINSAFGDTNNRLVVVRFSGAARYLHLSANQGRLSINTEGQTWGHAAARNAFSVAAVNVATAGGGAFTGGAPNPVETTSSDGPRRIFYQPNGTAITPGNFSSTGGEVLQKPDLAAADCVATSTPGLSPLCGTTAAAPHAAAIAALMLEAVPTLTRAAMQAAISRSRARHRSRWGRPRFGCRHRRRARRGGTDPPGVHRQSAHRRFDAREGRTHFTAARPRQRAQGTLRALTVFLQRSSARGRRDRRADVPRHRVADRSRRRVHSVQRASAGVPNRSRAHGRVDLRQGRASHGAQSRHRRPGVAMDAIPFPSAGKRDRKNYMPLEKITSCSRPKVMALEKERTLLHPADAHCQVPAPAHPVEYRRNGGLTVTRVIRSWLFAALAMVVCQAALSAQAEVPSTSHSQEAQAPGTAPEALKASASDALVVLSWRAVERAAGYRVFRAVDGVWEPDPVASVNDTTYTNSGLANGTTYTFAVAAYDDGGTGPRSIEVTATPVAPVRNQSAVTVGAGGVTAQARPTEQPAAAPVFAAPPAPPASTTPASQTAVARPAAARPPAPVADPPAPVVVPPAPVVASAPSKTDSPSVETVTPPPPPPASAPTGLAAMGGEARVTLSWQPVSGATGYYIFRATAGVWNPSPVAVATTTAYANTGLTNGTIYSYRLAAYNGGGSGPQSPEVNAVPLTSPKGLKGDPGDTETTVTWQASPGATTYTVYRSTSDVDSTFAVHAANLSTLSLTDTGLTNNTRYYYRVRATAPGGTSDMSAKLSVTPLEAPPADPPASLVAAPGNARVVLTWTAVAGATSYRVFRSTTGGVDRTPIATVTILTFTNTGLTNGTSYTYQVAGRTTGGDGPLSAAVSATPLATPSAPAGLMATGGDRQIVLKWVASPGAATYNVYRGTAAGAQATTPVFTGLTGVAFVDTTIVNGPTYFYKVTALNTGGESPRSPEVSATAGGAAARRRRRRRWRAFRLLRQATWGPRPGDVDHVKASRRGGVPRRTVRGAAVGVSRHAVRPAGRDGAGALHAAGADRARSAPPARRVGAAQDLGRLGGRSRQRAGDRHLLPAAA